MAIISSHTANHQFGAGRKILEWQAGYGVVSFGTKDLPWVIRYIRNQKEHHARNTAHDRLERIDTQPTTETQTVAEAEHQETP